MNKYKFLFIAAMAIATTACVEEELASTSQPVKTGDEIIFGSSLNGDHNVVYGNGTKNRTIYGERTTTGIPVHWVDNDQIAIFCPQASAPASHLVNYKVTPDKLKPNTASSVVKVDPAGTGLQWGEAPMHKFFGIYPASIVKGAEMNDQQGIITASLPVLQQPVGWREETKTTANGTTQRIIRGEPNMNYSVMFAYNEVMKSNVTADNAISLPFWNLVTVLDIFIQGPAEDSITITNVNIDAIGGTNADICGDFTIDVSKYSTTKKVVCKAIPSNVETHKISIPCYDSKNKKFIKLGSGDMLNVKAFIIPDTETPDHFRHFKITVASLNGSANSISLDKFNNGTNSPTDPNGHKQEIVPHKINRILLPKVEKGEPVNWMSYLDNNIYLTELSIPGSKFSYLTKTNGASTEYQSTTVKEQFATGIRAFIVQTGADVTYNVTRENIGTSWWPEYRYTYTFNNANSLPVVGAKAGTTLETTLQVISEGLKSRPTECAFLILTCGSQEDVKRKYNYSGLSYGNGVSAYRAWIEAVKHQLNLLKAQYPIYDKEITAETTLGDVRGKIIIKVNTNEQEQEQYMAASDAVPALYSQWLNPQTNTTTYVTEAPLRWGTINPNSGRTPMKWMASEVTHVGNGAEISKPAKETSIRNMLQAGVEKYNDPNNLHDTYFMVDLGGKYVDSQYAMPTMDLAKDMNKIALDDLLTRKQNAATGLVFMNFADRGNSGKECKSDYIIATVIDNNFKFALRKRGTNTQK